VALVQEAVVARIDEARLNHSVALCDLGPTTTAGTAVLVRGFETGPAPGLSISPETYIATVEVRTPAGPLVAVDVHVYPGDRRQLLLPVDDN
jgi:hypothetical protein